MDRLKDKMESLTNKLTGKDKYHSNLLGESLPDLLRKATAKTLVTPDEAVNGQVVDTIQQEVASGKDTKEIVSLLKKRLRTDNPQKQWLGVLLYQRVMVDCANVLGMHQEQMLQEVARVMARPAKPETEAGKMARHAAKELLRKYGRAGNTAFRAAHQEVYGRGAGGGGASGYSAGAYGTVPGAYADAATGYPVHDGMEGPTGVEQQSLAEEIILLIDKAKSNTELLADMLVNTGTTAGTPDEFEGELIRDLMAEVLELRSRFSGYLEQLQSQEGPEMEVLMVQALEAVDTLDGCIALQKDISSNQDVALATSPNATGTVAGAAPAVYAMPAARPPLAPASAAPAAASHMDDLIALDDLADGMTASPAADTAAPVHDPFAASAMAPVLTGHAMGPPAVPAVVAAPAPAPGMQPQPVPLKSAFENMYLQAPAQPAPAAYPYAAQPAAMHGLPQQPGQQQYMAAAGMMPMQAMPAMGAPHYGLPGSPVAQPEAPTQGFAPSAYAVSSPPGPSPYTGMSMQQAPPQMYAGSPPASLPTTSNNPFAAPTLMSLGLPAAFTASSAGMNPHAAPQGLPTSGGGAPSTNPFAPLPAAPAVHTPEAGVGVAPGQQDAATYTITTTTTTTTQHSVDAEWSLFFEQRAAEGRTHAATAAAAAPYGAPQALPDFEALMRPAKAQPTIHQA